MKDRLYLGVDLGTSALKVLVMNRRGEILNTASEEYPLIIPKPGWSEQNPEEWWLAFEKCMKSLKDESADKGYDLSDIAGIGCGGQMHGLVILDKEDNVIRPAILWNDGRTSKEVDYLNNVIGVDKLSSCTANMAFAGFTAPKILWLAENEPENFKNIEKIMLPKDYLNYKLTGVHSCDYSDASGMLLLDVENRRWSKEMLEICGVDEKLMPGLYESYEVTGRVKTEVADKFGLGKDVIVTAGAGDNAAAAIGTGAVSDGACNISLGTSGTIFISSDKFGVDPNNALHSFAHANGKYHLMGCMLSAASCNKWFCDSILCSEDYSALQSEIDYGMLGKNTVYFLPYLMGERSPINDTDARGTFFGLSMNTSRKDMLLAVLEGVAFAIRDSFEVAKSIGINIEKSMICGGGSKSRLWCDIISDVLNIKLDIPVTEQGPGYGGAILAMVACGEYPSVEEAAGELVSVKETITPDPQKAELYNKRYEVFSKLYPANKEIFKIMAEDVEKR